MALVIAPIVQALTAWIATYTALGSIAAYYVASVIVYAAAAFAVSGISRMLRKNPEQTNSNGIDNSQTQTIRQAAASRTIVYGEVRVGGVLVYIATSGLENEYLHMVVAHCTGESEAIGDVLLGPEVVPLDGSGNATGTYAGYCTILKHLGSDTQIADAALVAAMPGEWTSSHRLRGITYTYTRLKYNTELFPSGIPNISALVKGRKVYDPRSTLTVWSDNAALCLRDYMTLPLDGLGADSAEIDDAMVIEAANICDEAVNIAAGGAEARYTINGVVDTNVSPGSIIVDMLGAMAGCVPHCSGKFRMRAGAYVTPRATAITLDDITSGIKFIGGDSLRECFNVCKGTFLSPQNQWQEADFPPQSVAAYVTEDGGVRIPRDVTFPYTTSPSRAQRIARIELEQSRRDKVIEFNTKLTCMDIWIGDTVKLTIARYGWTDKIFEVLDFSFVVEQDASSPHLRVRLILRETDSAVWTWTTGDEKIVTDAIDPTIFDPRFVATPSAPTLSTSNLMQPDGPITPRMQIQWSASSDVFVKNGGQVLIQYKKSADATWINWSPLPGSSDMDFITDVQGGISYDAKFRFKNVYGVFGAYSPVTTYTVVIDTTAPAAPTGLVATSGPGCVVLDWDDNTETDLDHYDVYRNTVNTFPGGLPIWTGYASQHADFSAVVGTTYYYWLKAVDTTDNKSTATASVNAAATSATGAAGGFSTFVYQRAATIPATPTGSTIPPTSWYDAPPAADGNPLWMSTADFTGAGVLVGAWATPVQLEGAGLVIEYSIDGSTSWHSTFASGDLYARQKVFGGSFSSAYRIVGENGTNGTNGTDGAGVSAANGSFSGIGLNSGGQSTCATASKTPTGTSCLVTAMATMENLDSVADSGVTVRVFRDSTLIGAFQNFDLSAYETEVGVPLTIADTGLTAGVSYTYTIKAYRTVSGATIDCQSCSLSVVG